MPSKDWSIKLSLLLIIAVILSLIAQASVNRDLIQADSDPDTLIDPISDYVKELNAVSGSATADTNRSVAQVQISINRSDTGNYWNGSAWLGGGQTWINASPTDEAFDTATESWVINTSTNPQLPTWNDNITYYIEAMATDNESSSDTSHAIAHFIFTPPDTTMESILDYVEDVNAISGSATEIGGLIRLVEIQINRSDDGNVWNGSAWQGSLIWINTSPTDGYFDSATESWTINKSTLPSLPTWVTGSTYYIQARAVDNESIYDLTPATESFTIGDIGWEIMETDVGEDLYGIWGNSSSDIFTVGGNQSFKTTVIEYYNGATWNLTDTKSGYIINDVWGHSSYDIFAVGEWGTILRYNNPVWTSMESGSSEYLYSIWGSNASDVFAVGGMGTILHYNGSAWNNMSSGTTYDLTCVWGNSSADIFAVGMNNSTFEGIILHYNGSAWTINSSGVLPPLTGVWGSSGSDVFAVGGTFTTGNILHYNGSSWNNMSSGTSLALWTVWGTSGSNVFAGGLTGTILHYQGISWVPSYSGTDVNINALWGNIHDVYAVGDKGIILHYNSYTDRSVYLNSPKSVAVGQNFSVIVGISRTTDLYTGQFSLEYDPDIIRVVSPNVSKGLLYGNTTYPVLTAGNWSLNGSRPDNQGKIRITFDLSNCTNPIGDTEGTLAEIYFNANSSGTTNLSFVPVLNLSDYYSTEIPINWYNDSITVKTSQPPDITTLNCSTVNHSTIRLTWNATGTGGGEYDIRYRQGSAITDSNWAYWPTIRCDDEYTPQAAPASEFFDVTGLDDDTKYYFAIKVSDPDSFFSNLSNTNSNCTTPPWLYDLNITANPINGGTTNGSGTYLHDLPIGINATPNGSCWDFINWTGNTSTIANVNSSDTTITMRGNYSITANFVIKALNLNISVNGNGSVTSPGTGLQGPYDCGDTVNLSAAADPNYAFISWTGNTDTIADVGAASTNITMYDNYSITANFGLPPVGLYGDANNDTYIDSTDISYVKLTMFMRWNPNPGIDASGDGVIDSTDISYIKLIMFRRWNASPLYEAPYDFLSSAGITRLAKSKTISSPPPTLADNFKTNSSGWVEATDPEYGYISTTDGTTWNIIGSTGNYSTLQCKFSVVEDPADVTSIGVTLNASAETNGDILQLWAWNFNTGSWRKIGNNLTMTTSIATYTSWTNWGKVFTDYIDSGDIYILANLNNSNENLNIDYIKLMLAHP